MSLRRIIVALLTVQAALLDAHFGFSHGAIPMAIVLIEGFDHLSNTTIQSKGWNSNFSSMQPGRFDGQCARLSSAVTKTKSLPATYTTLYAGIAYRVTVTLAAQTFFVLRAGGTSTFQVGLNSAGRLIISNSSGTVIATGTTVLTNNTWNYIEVKAVINGASGTCELRLNGASEIATTTGNFGSTALDTIAVVGGANTEDFDDIYVLDSTGSAPRNTFLGDVRVETIFPTGSGAHTAWTPNGAAANWDCVNDTTPDDDTTYVSDSTPNDIDSYAFGDIDAGATVYALQVCSYARKDDASTRQVAPLIRQASTDYVGTTVTLSSSYVDYTQIYNQDPTAADWTAANVNADEFGIKEIS